MIGRLLEADLVRHIENLMKRHEVDQKSASELVMIVSSGSPKRDEDYGQVICNLLPEIRKTVSLACTSYRHKVRRDEIEDLCQQTVLLLMQADYRCLRSFDYKKASLKTWLRSVVKHHISRYMRRQERLQNAEEIWVESIGYQSALKLELLVEERQKALHQFVGKLTRREKRLYELLCRDDLTDADIAGIMSISSASVRRRRYDLIRKIKTLIKNL